MSITKELDELGQALADMLAYQGEEAHGDFCRRLDALEKIVRRNWPDKLKAAKKALKASYEE
jgi:hypothetical protein